MTYNLAWVTDPHLNFVHKKRIEAFCRRILESEPDGLVITGDISEAPFLVDHLAFLDKNMPDIPIFFVCGNHDFYHGHISQVRDNLANLFQYEEGEKMAASPRLAWLGVSGVVPLTEKTALVGADGWYDGLYADWMNSRVELNDYRLIKELSQLYGQKPRLLNVLRGLAQESANYLEDQLTKALSQGYEKVVAATHVAPWRENAVHNGKISDDNWMPHFSSRTMGEAIVRAASQYPGQYVKVLCGHSHSAAYHKPLKNIDSYTGKARYKHPDLAGVINLP